MLIDFGTENLAVHGILLQYKVGDTVNTGSSQAAAIERDSKQGIAENEVANSHASSRPPVGPSSAAHDIYQGSVSHPTSKSLDHESPSSYDTRFAISQSQERHDAASEKANQNDSKKAGGKRKRADLSSTSEAHIENFQQIDTSNLNERKGKLGNKVEATGNLSVKGNEHSQFNMVQSSGQLERILSLPNSLRSTNITNSMPRAANFKYPYEIEVSSAHSALGLQQGGPRLSTQDILSSWGLWNQNRTGSSLEVSPVPRSRLPSDTGSGSSTAEMSMHQSTAPLGPGASGKVHGAAPGASGSYRPTLPGIPSTMHFGCASFDSHALVAKMNKERSREAFSAWHSVEPSATKPTLDSKYWKHGFTKGAGTNTSERTGEAQFYSANRGELVSSTLSTGKAFEHEGGASNALANANKIIQEMAEPEKYWTQDDFKEYVHKELNWSRIDLDGITRDGYPISDAEWRGNWMPYHWIFWSREHNDPDPLMTLPYDNRGFISLDPNNPTVKDKVRLALRQFLLPRCTKETLVQFWAATTLDGRTLLTTQGQPFALNVFTNDRLCEYRMICKDYTFYVDVMNGEEELGIPGRVYRNKCPEYTPDVEYYSVKEYPQRDHAIRCGVRQSLHLPVIKDQTCVGVLELVGRFMLGDISDSLYAAFQGLGLECFPSCEHHEMREKNDNKAHELAFMEIKRVLKLLCKIYQLPLALTWVPCKACTTLLPVKDLCSFLEFKTICYLSDFSMDWLGHYLRKGIVVDSALSSPNLLYCPDVTQFSLAVYPLVHFARKCRLRDCFAISLQSDYPGNDVYVLEIFLPARIKDEDPLSSLSKLLETMKKEFNTFRLASGEELGGKLSVEVIEFQNGQKHHYVQTLQVTGSLPSLEPVQNGGEIMEVDSSDHQSINAEQCEIDVTHPQELGTKKTSDREHKNTGVRIEIPYEDILHYSKLSRCDAARSLQVSISTFKRVCRNYGISRWPPRSMDKVCPPQPSHVDHQEEVPQLNSNLPSNHASSSIAHTQPHDTVMQNANAVNVKAKYFEGLMVLFPLSLSSTLEELYDCIETRLPLSRATYQACYIDGDNDKITITCDQDLQFWLCNSPRSPGSNAVVLHIDPISQLHSGPISGM